MSGTVDIAKQINSTKISFHICPDLWKKFDLAKFGIHNHQIREVKFLNQTGDEMSHDMSQLPSDTGGIYFFYIRSGIVPNSDYLVYIGRAWYTNSQNLKKRCRSYFQKYPNERPKINRLIKDWGPYLYIRYIELTDEDQINELEKQLINSILPPFNDQIPDKTIRDAVKAFL